MDWDKETDSPIVYRLPSSTRENSQLLLFPDTRFPKLLAIAESLAVAAAVFWSGGILPSDIGGWIVAAIFWGIHFLIDEIRVQRYGAKRPDRNIGLMLFGALLLHTVSSFAVLGGDSSLTFLTYAVTHALTHLSWNKLMPLAARLTVLAQAALPPFLDWILKKINSTNEEEARSGIEAYSKLGRPAQIFIRNNLEKPKAEMLDFWLLNRKQDLESFRERIKDGNFGLGEFRNGGEIAKGGWRNHIVAEAQIVWVRAGTGWYGTWIDRENGGQWLKFIKLDDKGHTDGDIKTVDLRFGQFVTVGRKNEVDQALKDEVFVVSNDQNLSRRHFHVVGNTLGNGLVQISIGDLNSANGTFTAWEKSSRTEEILWPAKDVKQNSKEFPFNADLDVALGAGDLYTYRLRRNGNALVVYRHQRGSPFVPLDEAGRLDKDNPTLVIGRNQYGDDHRLSRRHIEITLTEGGVRVSNLSEINTLTVSYPVPSRSQDTRDAPITFELASKRSSDEQSALKAVSDLINTGVRGNKDADEIKPQIDDLLTKLKDGGLATGTAVRVRIAAGILLRARLRNIVFRVGKRPLDQRTIDFLTIAFGAIERTPTALLNKTSIPIEIDFSKIEKEGQDGGRVLGYAHIGDDQGSIHVGMTAHALPDGGFNEVEVRKTVIHELLHKLTTMTVAAGSLDLIFPFEDWLAFLKGQGLDQVLVNGKLEPTADYLDTAKHGRSEVIKRIRRLNGKNFPAGPGTYGRSNYQRHPHEILVWNAMEEGQDASRPFGKDAAGILKILQRTLFRDGDTVFSYDPKIGEWRTEKSGEVPLAAPANNALKPEIDPGGQANANLGIRLVVDYAQDRVEAVRLGANLDADKNVVVYGVAGKMLMPFDKAVELWKNGDISVFGSKGTYRFIRVKKSKSPTQEDDNVQRRRERSTEELRAIATALVKIVAGFSNSGQSNAGLYVHSLLGRPQTGIEGIVGKAAPFAAFVAQADGMSDAEMNEFLRVLREEVEVLPDVEEPAARQLIQTLARLGLPIETFVDFDARLPGKWRVMTVNTDEDLRRAERIAAAMPNANIALVVDPILAKKEQARLSALKVALPTLRIAEQSADSVDGNIIRLRALRSDLADIPLADMALILSDGMSVDTSDLSEADSDQLAQFTVIFLNQILSGVVMNGLTLDAMSQTALIIAKQA